MLASCWSWTLWFGGCLAELSLKPIYAYTAYLKCGTVLGRRQNNVGKVSYQNDFQCDLSCTMWSQCHNARLSKTDRPQMRSVPTARDNYVIAR